MSGASVVVNAFAAHEAKATLKPFTYELRPFRDTDIDIKISHCGVCHSDIHSIDNANAYRSLTPAPHSQNPTDWKNSKYPIVPGHEIIGSITALGTVSTAAGLKIGDRVGVGPTIASCNRCDDCHTDPNVTGKTGSVAAGGSQYCLRSTPVYNGRDPVTKQPTYGGFADQIRVSDYRWVFKIPDSLPSETAAPLLCAGITLWTPLSRFVNSSTAAAATVAATENKTRLTRKLKVGVIGIGGLGHLAVQFAHKLGCETVALTTSADKSDLARSLGAGDVIVTSDWSSAMTHRFSFDLLLCTVNANLSWNQYLLLLKTGGTLCLVGIPEGGAVKINPSLLVMRRLSVTGSAIGAPRDYREMLAFAARHSVVATTELFAMSEVNAALAKVKANTIRFRAVLKSKL